MNEPLKPSPGVDDFQTAAQEQIVPVPLAFRDDDAFAEELED